MVWDPGQWDTRWALATESLREDGVVLVVGFSSAATCRISGSLLMVHDSSSLLLPDWLVKMCCMYIAMHDRP